MRVQPAHHLAHQAGALDVAALRAQAHLVGLVQDAAVHRLEAVPRVREGPGVDDGVGVLEERALHLVHDVDVEDALLEVSGGRGLRTAAGHRGGAPLRLACFSSTSRRRGLAGLSAVLSTGLGAPIVDPPADSPGQRPSSAPGERPVRADTSTTLARCTTMGDVTRKPPDVDDGKDPSAWPTRPPPPSSEASPSPSTAWPMACASSSPRTT